MLLCGRWPTKLVALRQTVRRKCHQGGGDAGSGRRHRELRITLGELPVVLRSHHDRPPSEIAFCTSTRSREQRQPPTARTPVRSPSRMVSLPQSAWRVLGADLNRSESSRPPAPPYPGWNRPSARTPMNRANLSSAMCPDRYSVPRRVGG